MGRGKGDSAGTPTLRASKPRRNRPELERDIIKKARRLKGNPEGQLLAIEFGDRKGHFQPDGLDQLSIDRLSALDDFLDDRLKKERMRRIMEPQSPDLKGFNYLKERLESFFGITETNRACESIISTSKYIELSEAYAIERLSRRQATEGTPERARTIEKIRAQERRVRWRKYAAESVRAFYARAWLGTNAGAAATGVLAPTVGLSVSPEIGVGLAISATSLFTINKIMQRMKERNDKLFKRWSMFGVIAHRAKRQAAERKKASSKKRVSASRETVESQ